MFHIMDLAISEDQKDLISVWALFGINDWELYSLLEDTWEPGRTCQLYRQQGTLVQLHEMLYTEGLEFIGIATQWETMVDYIAE